MANNFDLLDHQIRQFGAVDVLEVLLRDPVSKEPILLLDTLKVSSIAMEGQSKEIKGGIGAPTLIEYDYGRTVNFEMQDALASIESLATMWGGKYNDAVSEPILGVFTVTTGEAGAVTLPEGVVIDDLAAVRAYNATTRELAEVGGSAEAPTIGTEAGLRYQIFVEGTPETAMTQLTIDGISVPPTVELIGRTFFIERNSGKQMEYQLRIPMLKINVGGGLTMEAEGDAAVFDFSGKALLDPITKELFTLTRTGREWPR